MKTFSQFAFFFFCLIPLMLTAQFTPTADACSEITKLIHDEKTEVTRVVSKSEIRINDLGGKGLFQIILMRSHDDYSFIIKHLEKECFDNDTEVNFHFRDGSAIQFKSSNKDNCESLVLVSMGGIYKNQDKIEQFLNSYLIGISFKSAKEFPYRLKIETPHTELVQELFECMAVAY